MNPMAIYETQQRAHVHADDFVLPLTRGLKVAGFRAVRTFELRSACVPVRIRCPHHGQGPCDCQLIVLLVYDWLGSTYSLTVQGSGHQCEIELVEAGPGINQGVVESIQLVIELVKEECAG
jgi:hypothetical protein